MSIPDVPTTIAELPFFVSGRYPKPDLLGRCTASGVTPIAGRELIERVRDLSLGLRVHGMAAGDRVVLLAESRPEWLLTDFAILTAGAITVPIYPTLSAEQIAFIIRDCEARFAIVSTADQLQKLLSVAATLPSMLAVLVMDRVETPTGSPVPVHALADVAGRGHQQIVDGWGVGRRFHDDAKRVSPADPATIIYTSGTTGPPKGVLLTHGNLMANLRDVLQVFDLGETDVALSFLPLCHSFERMVAYLYLSYGVSMIFAESIETIPRDLKTVRPTVITGVPRVFEKLHARVVAAGQSHRGLKRRIFARALAVADARGATLPEGGRLSLAMRAQSALAERVVFQKVREAVGGRLRFAVSGSAPLRADIARFFYGIGVPVLEGYGLTETSPVLTVNPLEAVRIGTVGPPLASVEIRIADDGEILARGPNVMSGYYRRPQETAEALSDGWFHTGDIGAFDPAGYLRITDRKKELIVTSGGKKIAPQPIEAGLRAHELVAEAVLVGEQRHYPAALLVPDFSTLSARLGVSGAELRTTPSLLDRADVQHLYQQAVDAVNEQLAQFERIKRFAVLAREFSIEAGELTPTLKVRRQIVETRYKDLIEGLYR
jgi:long-chain acyl-CoA synthetase